MASKQAQTPVGERKWKCTEHTGMELTLVCDNCGGRLVCQRCIVTNHRGHELSEPEDEARKKRLVLTDKLKNIHGRQARLRQNLSYLSEAQDVNESSTSKSISKIRAQKNRLKAEVDKIAEKLEEQCFKQSEHNSNTIVNSNIDCISLISKLDEYETLLKNVLETGSDFDIVQFDSDISDVEQPEVNDELPLIPSLRFIETSDKAESDLRQYFGDFEWKKKSLKRSESAVSVSSLKERPLPPPPPQSSVSQMVERSPKVGRLGFTEIHQISKCGSRIRTVCPTGNDNVWVSQLDDDNRYTKEICLIPKDGGNIMTAVLDAQITDVTIMPDGTGNAVITCWDKTIRKIKADGTCSLLFDTDTKPTGVCIDNEGNIVVTFRDDGKIVKYNVNHDKIKILKSFKRSIKLFKKQMDVKNPDGICSSDFSNDIAVIDADKTPKVVVLTKDLQIRYCFDGENALQDGAYDGILEKPGKFGPNGICFDKRDNLYIAEGKSLMVLVLNSVGRVIYRLGCSGAKPCGLAVDSKGLLWVGYSNGIIKVFKRASGNVYT